MSGRQTIGRFFSGWGDRLILNIHLKRRGRGPLTASEWAVLDAFGERIRNGLTEPPKTFFLEFLDWWLDQCGIAAPGGGKWEDS